MPTLAILVRRALRANRLPLLTCGISVAAGVALATSGLVLTDAMRDGLAASGELSARHLDVAVRQRSVLRTPAGDLRARLPASTTSAVRAVAGVAGSDPVIEGYVDVAVDGRAVTAPGRGLVGRARSWGSDVALNPWRVLEGRAPSDGLDVVLDRASARRAGLALGRTVTVISAAGTRDLQLVGIAGPAGTGRATASAAGTGGVTALVSATTAAALFGSPEEIDLVAVDGVPGLAPSALAARLRDVLAPDVEVVTGRQLAEQERAAGDGGLRGLRGLIGAGAGLSLLVSLVLMASTFAVLAGRRQQEAAMLRLLGAQRGQLVGVRLGEAAVVGAAGAAVGAAGGLLLARLAGAVAANGVAATDGLGLPPLAAGWRAPSVLGPGLAGLLLTLGAAAIPAWRAGRLPPIRALHTASAGLDGDRRGGLAGPAGPRLRSALGALVLIAAAGCWTVALGRPPPGGGASRGLPGGTGPALGAAVVLSALGLVLAGPALLRAAARGLGRPAASALVLGAGLLGVGGAAVALASLIDGYRRGMVGGAATLLGAALLAWAARAAWGVGGALARRAVRTRPHRAAAAAAGLAAAVGVLSTLVVVAGSLRAAVGDAVERGFHGDFVVEPSAPGLTGLPTALRAELAGRPELSAVTGMGLVWAQLGGASQALPAVVAAEAAPLFDVGVTGGDLAGLDGADGGVAVQQDRARREGWRLGDEVEVTLPVAGAVRFPIVALYRDGDLAGDVLIGRDALGSLVADAGDRAVFVGLAEGVSRPAGRAVLAEVVGRYPAARLSDAGEYGRRQQATIDQLLGLLVALTGVGLVLALVGVASAGALGVLERRRELALLRVTGASVAQLQRMLRWEAVIAAIAGTATGTVLGILAAAAILAGVAQGGFRHLSVPLVPLLAISALSVVGSAAASLLTGRRLARLSVVEALTAE